MIVNPNRGILDLKLDEHIIIQRICIVGLALAEIGVILIWHNIHLFVFPEQNKFLELYFTMRDLN